MKNLLEQDFISYYNRHKDLPVEVTITQRTTKEDSFGLKDDEKMIYSIEESIAKYKNSNNLNVFVINYENFINLLPPRVKKTNAVGKDICDLIVYTNNYFLLNELTDTKIEYNPKKRIKAQCQLLQTLKNLICVENICQFVNTHDVKHCCFFNKQVQIPSQEINATSAFNRQNTYSNGFNSPNSDVEALGFEFWEFYGSQTYLLKDNR